MELSNVGVVGLGVMGGNLARNLASRGLGVLGLDHDVAKAHAVAARYPEAKLAIAEDARTLVRGLERPRKVILLVPAGAPVDEALAKLDPLLEEGDVVVDAGNSLFTDTAARLERLRGRSWRFVGMGVSGGAEGALHGPAMMPGGERAAWELLEPVLTAIAARSEHGPCVAWCGHGAAGHFVKMAHNGIEYGVMQLIAEVAMLARRGLGLEAAAVGAAFEEWNEGELSGFLVEITARILRVNDPRADGAPLVDSILDVAEQKGTGRWTARAALDLAVAVPTIAAAVDARVQSSQKAFRERGQALFGRPDGSLDSISLDDLRDALYASVLASHSQGFALMRAGSAEHGFETDLAEVARIWTGGCILRARLLELVMAALRSDPDGEVLALSPSIARELAPRVPSWRRVASAAAAGAYAVPALAASLAWFETLTTADGSASLIQAQRDLFGSHGYQRVDAPGVAQHTDWPG